MITQFWLINEKIITKVSETHRGSELTKLVG